MRTEILRAALTAGLFMALAGCGGDERVTRAEDYKTIAVKFPNGKEIRAEQVINRQDLTRGMMFRESLAPDRGMLFYHGHEGSYPYWMYQVKIPLDLVWLDKNKRIVQLLHKAPPCPGPRERCPTYGGAFPAAYVLEIAAGTAAANGLRPGMTLDF